ncbi:DUF5683 domain-containing protein [Maribacter arenosus]|uniref:DUF5683 domain-containing protein n=1 Tax=Maribacter arenosus TaxID=1854708 RepID=UPI00293BEDBA|nr:DUF5683 domain-containing protein [Maribacter arenosus]
MNNFLITLLFLIFTILPSSAQENDSIPMPKDSLAMDLKENGIVVQEVVAKNEKSINPLAPSKAAFYSAVLPGLGQVYNKRYWKVPIVYAVIGTGVYTYTYNDDLYDRFRTAFKSRKAGFTNDEFYDPDNNLPTPHFELDKLENQQERFQRDRDLALVLTIAMYVLNIIDANVDSHLKQFNINEDLSLDARPYLDLDPITNNPNYGFAFIIKF